eukprot:TRINITY_DN3194_c0_g3_i1.p1 TRINITY_DN3194_c0_g3~~TRINITY_DN3194_c0_g3_i1.p1  ORF type:complete len:674 (-),score=197.08 TRINITY_DN3194_c0_g3_i1:140-2140(-)
MVRYKDVNYILSKTRVKEMIARFGVNEVKLLKKVPFEDLVELTAIDPLLGLKCKLYDYEDVTDKYGTGIDPFSACNDIRGSIVGGRYKLSGTDILTKSGCIENFLGKPYAGTSCVDESGNQIVAARLKELNKILWEGKCEHAYFVEKSSGKRALIKTFPSWFLKVTKGIKAKLLRDLIFVNYVPKLEIISQQEFEKQIEEERLLKKKEKKKGKLRLYNHYKAYYAPFMSCLNEQDEISISEINPWSIPIPCFKDRRTGDLFTNEKVIAHVASKYKQLGSDSWYSSSVSQLLPEEYKDRGEELEKTYESFDAMFIGAVSPYFLGKKINMATECYSQHGNWISNAVYLTEALTGKVPFHVLKTHGKMVDKYGDVLHDMVYPLDIIEGSVKMDGERRYGLGTDVLRAWAAVNDTDSNIALEEVHLDEINKMIKRVRVEVEKAFLMVEGSGGEVLKELNVVDVYVLKKLFELTSKLKDSYDKFVYKGIVEGISDFMGGTFADYLKINSSGKRAGTRFVIQKVLETLARVVQPVLPYLSAELFEALGIKFAPQELRWPAVEDEELPAESLDALNDLFELREELSLILDEFRLKRRNINSKDLVLVISSKKKNGEIEEIDYNLASFFGIGRVEIVDELKMDIKVHLKTIRVGRNNITAHLQRIPPQKPPLTK